MIRLSDLRMGRKEIVVTVIILVIFLVALFALVFNYFDLSFQRLSHISPYADYEYDSHFVCPTTYQNKDVEYCEVRGCAFDLPDRDYYMIYTDDPYTGSSSSQWDGYTGYEMCSDWIKIDPPGVVDIFDCYSSGSCKACDNGPKFIIYYEEDEEPQCDPGWISGYRCSGDWRERKYLNEDCTETWESYEYCTYGCSNGQCLGGCIEEWLNNYRCSGDWRQREKRYTDCSTGWLDYEYCDYGCSGTTCNSQPGTVTGNLLLEFWGALLSSIKSLFGL